VPQKKHCTQRGTIRLKSVSRDFRANGKNTKNMTQREAARGGETSSTKQRRCAQGKNLMITADAPVNRGYPQNLYKPGIVSQRA
jgi:hypothetical protein